MKMENHKWLSLMSRMDLDRTRLWNSLRSSGVATGKVLSMWLPIRSTASQLRHRKYHQRSLSRSCTKTRLTYLEIANEEREKIENLHLSDDQVSSVISHQLLIIKIIHSKS